MHRTVCGLDDVAFNPSFLLKMVLMMDFSSEREKFLRDMCNSSYRTFDMRISSK